MKKLFLAFTMMLGFAIAASAQTAVKKTETKTVAVKPVAAPAKVVAMDKTTAKPAATKAAVKPAASATAKPVKADGTPDMRFKENQKNAAPAAGPKKADGTPDMRYKENQKPKGKGK